MYVVVTHDIWSGGYFRQIKVSGGLGFSTFSYIIARRTREKFGNSKAKISKIPTRIPLSRFLQISLHKKVHKENVL